MLNPLTNISHLDNCFGKLNKWTIDDDFSKLASQYYRQLLSHTMTRPPLPLLLLMLMYLLLAIVALWRAIDTQSMDLFSLGVIPVLIGMVLKAKWATVVLKVYIAIQALGFSALATTAILAYQISPEDVKVVVDGQSIPIPLIAAIAILLLAFQLFIAFSKSTKSYLTSEQSIG